MIWCSMKLCNYLASVYHVASCGSLFRRVDKLCEISYWTRPLTSDDFSCDLNIGTVPLPAQMTLSQEMISRPPCDLQFQQFRRSKKWLWSTYIDGSRWESKIWVQESLSSFAATQINTVSICINPNWYSLFLGSTSFQQPAPLRGNQRLQPVGFEVHIDLHGLLWVYPGTSNGEWRSSWASDGRSQTKTSI